MNINNKKLERNLGFVFLISLPFTFTLLSLYSLDVENGFKIAMLLILTTMSSMFFTGMVSVFIFMLSDVWVEIEATNAERLEEVFIEFSDHQDRIQADSDIICNRL